MLQRTVEQTLDESCVPQEGAFQSLEEVVEMERLAPHEQELQLTAVQMAEMFRERYGDRDACLNALHDLKAQQVARWEMMC